MSGNFTNDGGFVHNSGTVIFSGNTTFAGASNPAFNHITSSGTLNGPTNLLLVGNFTNNNSFVQGANKVTFNAVVCKTSQDHYHLIPRHRCEQCHTGNLVSVEHSANLEGVLTLGAGAQFDADGSGNSSVFTLLSTADLPATQMQALRPYPPLPKSKIK